MKNNYFAYKKEWSERKGYYDDTLFCCALSEEFAREYRNTGKCGTLACPFYKPHHELVRLGDNLRMPK